MQKNQPYFISSVGFAVVLLFLFSLGCYKDYSYEYRPDDSATIIDRTTTSLTSCAACKTDVLRDSSWQVTIEATKFCGTVVKPVVLPERTAFTFFGPSSCSGDSGFVASVFLSAEVLDVDKANLKARMSCYYYNKVGPSHVYMSSSSEPLEVLISSYTHQTGITYGTFRGVVFDSAGRRREVKDGRFRIRL